MFCQFLLYSKVTQFYLCIMYVCMYVYICVCVCVYTFFISCYLPSQVMRYSSLGYTAESHCLSIPDAVVCLC